MAFYAKGLRWSLVLTVAMSSVLGLAFHWLYQPRYITMSGSLSGEALEPSWQAKHADAIVIGTVSRKIGSKLSSPTKQVDPADSEMRLVYTDFEVTVDRVLGKKASLNQTLLPGSKVKVRILGGRAGGIQMRDDLSPEMNMGDNMLMFLSTDDPFFTQEGDSHFTLGLTGAFHLQNGMAERRGLAKAISLADLEREVNTVLNSPR